MVDQPNAIGPALSTQWPLERGPVWSTGFLRLRLASTLKNSTATENAMAK
jgi:hypothetical protein